MTSTVKIPKKKWTQIANYDCIWQSLDQNIFITRNTSAPDDPWPLQPAKIVLSQTENEFKALGETLYGYTEEGATIAVDPMPKDLSDFGAIAAGQVSGVFAGRKFARINDIDSTDGFLDVWDFNKNPYYYSTTAAIDSISSSSAAATQPIGVYGLDEDWNLKFQLAILNGQNRVALTTPLIRVYRLQNLNSTSLPGNVYVYENTTLSGGIPTDLTKVRAYIDAANGYRVPGGTQQSNNQTYMSQFAVPAGKTGYVTQIGFSAIKQAVTAVQIDIFIRPFGGIELSQGTLSLNTQGTTTFSEPFNPWIRVPEKTDIIVQANSSANNGALSIDYSFVLVNNDPTNINFDIDGIL